MSLINRCSMLIFPKQPVYDWQCQIFQDDQITMKEDIFGDDCGNVLLIPEMDHEFEFENWIKKNYEIFFDGLLEGWCLDEALWPKNRTYKMFREWFHVSYQSMVHDTMDTDIVRDDD